MIVIMSVHDRQDNTRYNKNEVIFYSIYQFYIWSQTTKDPKSGLTTSKV